MASSSDRSERVTIGEHLPFGVVDGPGAAESTESSLIGTLHTTPAAEYGLVGTAGTRRGPRGRV